MKIVELGSGTPGSERSGLWYWTLGSLGCVLAWDAAGLDLPLARLMGSRHGFSLREHWIAAGVLHDGARLAAWLLGLWLLAGLRWPTGLLRQVAPAARLQWLAATAVSLLLISGLKLASQTSCPWDLSEFGGAGSYLSHWAWGRSDGGPGHCFPAGHASAGFAFLGGYFALRRAGSRWALVSLATAIAAGLILGLAQQLRGAHFMSHTLWTAWLCWITALAVDRAVACRGILSQALPAS